MLAPRPRSRERLRRGIAGVEFLLILPIFMIVVGGMVGIADLLITEQVAAEASSRGARAAALGGSRAQVEEAVRSVLGERRFKMAKIYIGPIDGSQNPVPPGGMIEVRVELPARKATVTHLAPVSSDETVIGRTVMQRE